MRFLTVALFLCCVSTAVAQQNAAEKILNNADPFSVPSIDDDEAAAADIKQQRADEKKADRQEAKQQRQTYKAATKAPATAQVKPRRTWNKPRQVSPMQAWMAWKAQQAYIRANTPMMYVGPVMRFR